MRIALGVEYDGSGFCGWQFQEGVRTIQDCVEKGIANVADHPVRVVCAGRTDTGVHALYQVIHFDTQVERTDRSWVFGSNANLSADISVLWAKHVDDEFHARFSAIRRCYRYVIFNRPVRPTFLSTRVCWDYRKLDVTRMRRAAVHLLGEHNFNAYRARACQGKNPVKTIYKLNIKRQNDLIIIDVDANSFLHHMIRNIAGVLLAIGAGEKPIDWAKEVLDARDRTSGGVTALPNGLYFTDVKYPEIFNLPRLSETRMVW